MSGNEDGNVTEKFVNGNTIGNIRNEGKILEYGDYIVYASENGVYKISKDGSEYIKLSNRSKCQFLNLYNDRIYCVYNNTELYRINLDGSSAEQIEKDYGKLPLPYGLLINGDKMYIGCEYIVDLSILEENDNYMTLEQIYNTHTSPMSTINIVDDTIYFYGKETDSKKEKAGIYKMNEGGTQREKIYEGYVYCCIVDGEWAYCFDYATTYTTMFKFMLDGTEKEILLDCSGTDDGCISALNVMDGYIYYELNDMPDEKQNGIYRMRVDGTDNQLLTNNCSYEGLDGIYIVDEWIYYCPDELANELWRVKIDGTEDGLFVSLD